MITRIRTFPRDETALRTAAQPVGDITPAVHDFGLELAQWMRRHDGAGLASTQVERDEQGPAPALFVIDDEGVDRILINPVILGTYGREIKEEGCLSFGAVVWPVAAPTTVKLRFMSLDGAACEETFTGFLARCVAHEVDHLVGKLMVDRMARWERRHFIRRVQTAHAPSP